MTRSPDRVPSTADEIEQEAARWVIRLDRSRAPEVAQALESWLDENPRHQASFIRLSTAWRRADALRRSTPPMQH